MVRHHPTATIHAMKAISKRSVLAHDELAHTLTEIKILKQFAVYEPNNPFIVKLNYAFTDKENIYFVMDFYPGRCLRRLPMDGPDA
jgi:protein-serine/threonine kinase